MGSVLYINRVSVRQPPPLEYSDAPFEALYDSVVAL